MDDEKFYCEQLEEEAKIREKNFHPVLMFELAIMMVLFFIVAGTFLWMNSPEKIMKDYFKNLSSGKWNRIYDQLYLDEKEDQFLTKSLFISAEKLEEVSNKKNYWNLTAVRQLPGENKMKEQKFEVYYKKNGSEFRKEFTLVRKGLSWKIDGQEFVQHHIKINVPKGTKIKFDEIELKEENKEAGTEEVDTYILPSIFEGVHYITAEKKGREPYEELISFKEKEIFNIDMDFQQEVIEEVTNMVVAEVKQAYEEKIEEEKIKNRFQVLKLKNNKISVMQSGVNEVKITVVSDYEYQYKEKKQRKVKITGHCKNTLTYVRKKDQFCLTELNLDDGFL